MTPATPPTAEAPTSSQTPGRMAIMLGMSVVIGIVAALLASLFLWLVEEAQHLVFTEVPHVWGMTHAPWWWAGILLIVAAGIVWLARKMPGATGKGPLTGFHFDDPISMVPSVILAAFASLVAGVALGPEAPLIVVGTAVAGLLTMKRAPEVRRAMMFIGGAAAISAVFGNPFITGFMILEFVALGLAPAVLILPVFAALASSYLVSIGIWSIPGVGVHSLSVPGLPAYPNIEPGDLIAALVVALVAGVVALLARGGGLFVDRLAQKWSTPVLFAAAIVTMVMLLIGEAFGIAPDQILFSGNGGMATLVTQTSVGIVVVILVAKAIAYAVALGGGFRGGPIFPVTFLGVAVAVLAHLILPDVSVSALAAAGIAGSAGAFLKLPATSAMLGALLIAGAGAAIAPFAIFGAVVGFAVRLVVDARLARAQKLLSRTRTPSTL